MRSPPSRTRNMTNWPGCADAAINGASSTNSLVTGVSLRASSMGVISQLRVGVHRLETPPAALDFLLQSVDHLCVLRFEQVPGFAHQAQPIRNRVTAAGVVRVVGYGRVSVLHFVEREEATVDGCL